MRINLTLVGLADARRLCAAVEGCGVAVPKSLSDVLRAAETLDAAPSITDPTKDLVKTALGGHSSAEQVSKALEKAALARLVVQERKSLSQRVEPELVAEFGRRLDAGAADELLTALRPSWDDASLTLRDALSIVDIAADPATFLQTASAEEVAAYQRIGPAVTVLDRLSEIAAMFGPLASFPCVEDPRHTDPTVAAGWLSDVPVMCCSSDLVGSCAQFLKPRPAGDVRSSPWLKTVPFLHTIASASERLRAWAESAWAAQESERLKGGRLIDGVVVPDAPWRNPFQLEEATQR